jgi:DNA-binding HxlR family transcriptional regulator
MRRKSFADSPCAIARSLDVVGDWWSLLILRDAFDGNRRFGEFQKNLEIPKNILTVRLRALVDAAIFEVAPASDGSAYQEYVLTRKGQDLFNVVVALRQWGEKYAFPAGTKPAATLVDRKKGRPVGKLELKADDGRTLSYEDTLVAFAR